MAKVITDKELALIITRIVVEKTHIEEQQAYRNFLDDISSLLALHLGVTPGMTSWDPTDHLGWTCSFHKSECTPPGGGILADYDTDEDWSDE